GANRDRPAVAVHHDVVHDVKSEAGPRAHVLRGVERLEQAWHHVRWDAGAGVRDLDDDLVRAAVAPYPESPPSSHGVHGVVDEVRPDLVEFPTERLDGGKVRGEVALDLDTVAEAVLQHDHGVAQALVDVDHLHLVAIEVGIALHRADDAGDRL